jgi:hypothetical protein
MSHSRAVTQEKINLTLSTATHGIRHVSAIPVMVLHQQLFPKITRIMGEEVVYMWRWVLDVMYRIVTRTRDHLLFGHCPLTVNRQRTDGTKYIVHELGAVHRYSLATGEGMSRVSDTSYMKHCIYFC